MKWFDNNIFHDFLLLTNSFHTYSQIIPKSFIIHSSFRIQFPFQFCISYFSFLLYEKDP